MIVRTYGRRKPGGGNSRSFSDNDDDEDVYRDSFSSKEAAAPAGIFAFSSQDSAHFDTGGGVSRKPKRQKKGEVGKGETVDLGFVDYSVHRTTSTLMETQEFGEMMEHVDEVNFALDGLRKGQPLRIRSASLLSLLGICCTSPRRRLLRSHGMVKSVLDAIMGLSFDDAVSNMAAATLFHILISDGQDEKFLESSCCILFLIKLLKPVTSAAIEDKLPKIGSKLLCIKNDSEVTRGTSNMLDRTSVSIITKVKEILGSCKELKSTFGDDYVLGRPESSPRWIVLSIMEKSSVSTISLEENSGIVRKTGGNFKEKLREFGGLDAVFDVAMHCHTNIEGLKDSDSSSIWDARDGTLMESLVLLLKCLKIMENATFLSKDNQDYLLKLRGKLDCQGYRVSFPKLVLNVIKILSDLFLCKGSSVTAHGIKLNLIGGVASELALVTEDKGGEVFSVQSFKERCIMEESSSQRSSGFFLDNHLLSSAPSRSSLSEINTSSLNGSFSLKSSVPAASASHGEMSRSSNCQTSLISNGFKNFSQEKTSDMSENSACDLSEDTQDPFAFDEYEFEPSKWETLSGKKRSSRSKSRRLAVGEAKDMGQFKKMTNKVSDSFECSLQESDTSRSHLSQEASCSGVTSEESSSLLADCLLTAVKVLMNLTNDNIVGCQQIAASGGLEAMASIIAAHFPYFSSSTSSLFPPCEIEEYGVNIQFGNQKDNHLTDQELDFLVAILGLLVNLVEKDENNRFRLARASVTVNDSCSDSEEQKEAIPLFCSIFLSHRGDTKISGEENGQPWDPETIMEQGQKEAEKMIVEAYAALLLAFLSTESKRTREAIAACLPNHNLGILVPVLERFVAFHLTLDMMTPETHKAVSEVIESCRIP
ncbi:hypothetical protein SAY87_030538 [Trapa incisa]|uniref:WAPL domain-containing protein n=1 Tax=Trapa incisa TaxID=236973 RepID=A0AAN7KMK5_9MYRT|nr:hypothetical protein SAY87_030538 [Trapa incisa]